MKRMRWVAAIGIAAVSLMPMVGVAQSTDRWGCDDLDDYMMEMVEALPRESDEMFEVMEADDVFTVRRSVVREAADQMDEWAGNLDDMQGRDIPRAAREYHLELVDTLGLMSNVLYTVSDGDMMGMMLFGDSMEEQSAAMEEAMALGVERCGDDWPFGGLAPATPASELRMAEEVV